jgi:hypothetical protein
MGYADGGYLALGWFLRTGWMVGFFLFGRLLAEGYDKKYKAFFVILAFSFVLACMGGSNLGTHVIGGEPGSGSEDVVTDYQLTDAQRNKTITAIFLVSLLPGSVGILNGRYSAGRKLGDGSNDHTHK